MSRLASAWVWCQSAQGTGVLLYCGAYAALGLCLSSFGPVLLDLSVQTSATLRDTGFTLIIRSVGYLAGACAGPLYDRFPGHRILCVAMVLASLGTLGIVFARSSVALAATVSLQGVAMGLIDVGCNTLVLWLYPLGGAGPSMQAMHAAFAGGATVGPLLLRAVERSALGGTEGSSPEYGDEGSPLVGVGAYNGAFFIIAAVCAALAGAFLISHSPLPRTTATSTASDAATATGSFPLPLCEDSVFGAAGAEGGSLHAGGQPTAAASVEEGGSVQLLATFPPAVTAASAVALSSAHHSRFSERDVWRVVLLVAAQLFVYVGAETGFGAWVTPFAVLQLGWSEARGQVVAAVYWGAIFVGRVASVWVASLLSPSAFLRASMLASAVASVAMLAWAGASDAALWAGAVVFGLSMACVFPTTLTLAEEAFPVLGKHATVIMIGSAAGEMALPFTIALCFGGDPYAPPEVAGGWGSPMAMLWVVGVASVGNLAVLAVLLHECECVKVLLSQT